MFSSPISSGRCCSIIGKCRSRDAESVGKSHNEHRIQRSRIVPYARLDRKDRLYIPRSVRAALGLSEGGAVAYAVVDGELRLRKAEDPYAAYGPVTRRAMERADAHPEELRTLDQVMADLGITQAELDAVEPEPGLDDK
jgi:bifunctional DNA-binding transcriptional regulator/antitoxin component of YhaV-PrlF toxin-antitoxin module